MPPTSQPPRSSQPHDPRVALALFLVALIGIADGTTGTKASMSALYIGAVLATAWFGGWKTAAAVAIAASTVGFVANHPSVTGSGAADAALYWNWSTRLLAQLGIAYVVGRLREARSEIRALYGLLRMCAWCRRIHSEEGWMPLEGYVSSRTDTKFSHGICPDCLPRLAEESREIEASKPR